MVSIEVKVKVKLGDASFRCVNGLEIDDTKDPFTRKQSTRSTA